MNNYRNWHYQVSSKAKKTVATYLMKYRFPKFNKIHINYTVYFKDKRNRDIMNFVAVTDKFVLDHLVNIGVLNDDNYNFVPSYSIRFGGIAKSNYIEMEIKEID